MADIDQILAQGSQPIDLGAIFTEAYKIKEMKQEQAGTNALRQLWSDPNNLDPTTKEPTVNALANLAKVAPDKAMALSEQIARVDHDRALTSEEKAKADQGYDTLVDAGIRQPSLKAYNDTLKTTGSVQAAQAAAQRVFTDNSKELIASGEIPKEITDSFAPDFDFQRVSARSTLSKARNTDPTAVAGAWVTGVNDKGVSGEYNKITNEFRRMGSSQIPN